MGVIGTRNLSLNGNIKISSLLKYIQVVKARVLSYPLAYHHTDTSIRRSYGVVCKAVTDGEAVVDCPDMCSSTTVLISSIPALLTRKHTPA